MLGRLARYLRFLGQDAEYVRGRPDREIVDWAAREHRTLVTRDRQLASRVPGALLIRSPILLDQLRAVRAAYPSVDFQVAFTRCSECNGRLEERRVPDPESGPVLDPQIPPHVNGPVYACTLCRHAYWEGSHTARIRRTLVDVLGAG